MSSGSSIYCLSTGRVPAFLALQQQPRALLLGQQQLCCHSAWGMPSQVRQLPL